MQSKTNDVVVTVVAILCIVTMLLPAVLTGLLLFAVFKVSRLRWWYLAITSAVLILLGILIAPVSTFVPVAVVPYKLIYAAWMANPLLKDNVPGYLKNSSSLFTVGKVIWSGFVWGSLASSLVLLKNYFSSGDQIKTEEQKAKEREYQDSYMNQWNIKRIEKKYKQGVSDGVFLGVDKLSAKPIILTSQELNQHIALFGTTGSGKTTTIMNFVEAAVSQRKPLLFVDGKGDSTLEVTLQKMAEQNGLPFRVLKFGTGSWNYNPLSDGTYTEFKDRLLAATDWGSEPFFKGRADTYLQMMFRIFEEVEITVDMTNVVEYFAPPKLKILARKIRNKDLFERFVSEIDSYDPTHLQGMIDSVKSFISSTFGDLFMDGDNRTIRLTECFEKEGITLFSLNSMRYPDFAKRVGKLVTTDMKAAASIHGERSRKPVSLIFDEFNVFASSAVVDLINKSRSAGVEALISSQSLADIDKVDVNLRRQIIQNCNTVIIQRQNDPTDALNLAEVIGTEETYGMTYQADAGQFGGVAQTGQASMRLTRDYIVQPDELKRLGLGEAVILRKVPKFRVHCLKVRLVNDTNDGK